MRTEDGVFILDSKEMEKSKFEGVMVSKVEENQKRNSIIAKKGFYDTKGNYQTKLITSIYFEKDELNVRSLRKILIGIVGAMKPLDPKIPKIAVTEDVIKLLK